MSIRKSPGFAAFWAYFLASACSAPTGEPDVGLDAESIDAAVDVARAVDARRDAARETSLLDVPRDVRGDPPSERTPDVREADALAGDVSFDAACEAEDGSSYACSCLPQPPSCVQGACASGRTCVDTGCGLRCIAASSACAIEDDCRAPARCVAALGESRCVRSQPGCADSRDCAQGFACEDGMCHSRRVRCDAANPCPWGFVCDSVEGSEPFCRKLYPRCVSGANCRDYELCLDVDGDGFGECTPRGTCVTTMECASNPSSSGRVCGVDPAFRASGCAPLGVCRTDADCGQGLRCRDVWGDGVKECIRIGGCERSSDCAVGICGARRASDATSCIVR